MPKQGRLEGPRRMKFPDLDNPKDRWLPFMLFCGISAFGIYFFIELVRAAPVPIVGGLALCAFFAGGLFFWFTHRNP